MQKPSHRRRLRRVRDDISAVTELQDEVDRVGDQTGLDAEREDRSAVSETKGRPFGKLLFSTRKGARGLKEKIKGFVAGWKWDF